MFDLKAKRQYNPSCTKPVSQADFYDVDYIVLSETINRAHNDIQIKMANIAVQSFKSRYRKSIEKGLLNYDVDKLIEKCRKRQLTINSKNKNKPFF